MRTFLVVFSLVVIASNSGCASQAGSSGYREASQIDPATELRQDHEYMAAVERAASRRGVDVKWVNPPLKRVLSDSTVRVRPADGG